MIHLRSPGHIADARQALDDAIDAVTTLTALRLAAIRLNMPPAETTGDQFTAGVQRLLAAMGASGVSWDEAARRISGDIDDARETQVAS